MTQVYFGNHGSMYQTFPPDTISRMFPLIQNLIISISLDDETFDELLKLKHLKHLHVENYEGDDCDESRVFTTLEKFVSSAVEIETIYINEFQEVYDTEILDNGTWLKKHPNSRLLKVFRYTDFSSAPSSSKVWDDEDDDDEDDDNEEYEDEEDRRRIRSRYIY